MRLPRTRTRALPRPSLRTRVTAIASLVITATVVLGLLFMYLLQMQSVRRTIDGELRTYAIQIAQSAPTGKWPQPLPPSSLDASAEAQVLAPDGRVLAASRSLAGVPAVYELPADSDKPVRQKAADGVIPNEVRVVGLHTTVDGQPVSIVTGTSTSLLDQVRSEFLRHLLLGLPAILVFAAVTVWLVVGRALRPVTKIRQAVTDITSADLSQRVPEPGTSDEIGRLARTMNDMLARLDQSAQRQRRFVADASHELRSPLAAIRTTLEVGLAYPDRAPWPTIAERAAQQSARLEELIQQLLLLARADERFLAERRQPVDVGTLLEDVVSARQDPRITLDAEPGTVTVANPDHVRRLFGNVVDNAVRYASDQVVITCAGTADGIRVHIDDDGPGIPASQRERVFDRFVRLDSSRERGTGNSGLGLAIASEIALVHRGRIACSESPIGGARITVVLPLAAAPGDRSG